MSTAGKVLVVIVTLVSVVWVLLIAMVADLNRNWGAELQNQKEAHAKAEKDHAAVVAGFAKLKSDVDQEQFQTNKDVTALHAQVSGEERALTTVQEALARVTLQVASVEAQAKTAEAEKAQRQKELDDTKTKLAELRQTVQTLKADYEAGLAELDQLRGEFKTLLAENHRLVEQISRSERRTIQRTSLP
jgi:chromosome segregation ATPase